jgi:lysophospholipase L1-like esterase
MKRFFVVSLILFGSCTKPETPIVPFGTVTAVSEPIKYLALGDSYTAGTSIKPEERWAEQLAVKLKQESFNIKSTEILAQSGMVTGDLISLIKSKKLNTDYELVSLLIGVNNQFRGQTPDVFERDFNELLSLATNLAKGKSNRVFVLSLPDWGQTPYALFTDKEKITKEINELNVIAKAACDKQKIIFIDITPLSRLVVSDKSLVSSDDLHYSGKMYLQWAEKALSDVKKILKI